jgi:hypothetical protein
MLPSSGRAGPPPEWPLGKASKADEQLWVQLWATPQACVWEQSGYATVRVVARYVRKLLLAERPDAVASLQAEVRQLEDRLLISPVQMRRAGYQVSADELEERRAERAPVPSPERAKVRAFDPQLVRGGAAAGS